MPLNNYNTNNSVEIEHGVLRQNLHTAGTFFRSRRKE